MRTRISPGVYRDGDQLEFDVPELLRHLGIPDTEENRDLCVETAEQMAKHAGLLLPTATVSHTHAHSCPNCGNKFEHKGKRRKCPRPTKAWCPKCLS